MVFGTTPLDEALNAILVHRLVVGGRSFPKGHVLDAHDIEFLRKEGHDSVVSAQLEAGDVTENDAAAQIASAISAKGIICSAATTGRVNFLAREAGVFTVNRKLVDAVNFIDSSITLATLREFDRVRAGQVVATIKIIPYAVPESSVAAVLELCHDQNMLGVESFSGCTVGLVQGTDTALKTSVLNKTRQALEARLTVNLGAVATELRVAHAAEPMACAIQNAAAVSDIVVVFGASAVADKNDVLPSSIRKAGGTVTYVGMPVDPGNLLVLGEIDSKPVIGAPGCARSVKENGFDWVLDRLMAGMSVMPKDIAAMGVGGLLLDSPARIAPRDGRAKRKRDIAVMIAVLAAGQSSRTGGANKLLAIFDGKPLVRRSVGNAVEADRGRVIAVTGHMADEIAASLRGLDVSIVHNPAYALGLASSIKAALGAAPADCDGLMIHLGDMPAVSAQHIRMMIDRFRQHDGNAVIRAVTDEGERGNPVIIPHQLFEAISALSGDVGARHIIVASELPIVDVPIGSAARIDVDTTEAVVNAGGRIV
ncbi:4-diphosphocytidyl-2C-methyl-D-erythritol kinase [Brucellaceae bacterium VT-16-1752]|nr:4-diphosphocytidyl-2C-methyl-D-erythritol kinase [Brucellaceae bacterium VT-16-1752]